jgi:hypothetical protein
MSPMAFSCRCLSGYTEAGAGDLIHLGVVERVIEIANSDADQ